jgi:hypothetical protein
MNTILISQTQKTGFVKDDKQKLKPVGKNKIFIISGFQSWFRK